MRRAFTRDQSPFCHSIIRLAKDWMRSVYVSERGECVNTAAIVETIALKAALVEETSVMYRREDPSYLKAFTSFLAMIIDLPNLRVMFCDFYQESEIPEEVSMQRPLLLDPANPYHNLLGDKSRLVELLYDMGKHATERKAEINGVSVINMTW